MEIQPLQFGIKSITELNFYLRDIPKQFHDQVNPELLVYNIELNFNIDRERNLLYSTITAKVVYKDEEWLKAEVWPGNAALGKDQIELLMHLSIQIGYTVLPLSNVLYMKDSKESLDPNFFNFISENSLSTVRGIIFCKTQGTVLSNRPLPYHQGTV